MAQDQDAIIAFLADPATHGGGAVERRETHGAIVFLGPERAFKLKRAVSYPYMDFGTAEKRRAACEAELRLNRRTAPDLYLGVRSVGPDEEGAIAFDVPEDRASDWVVEMRRFDDGKLLSGLADRGELDGAQVDRLIDAVREFHDAEPSAPDAQAWPDHFRWVVEENLEEIVGRTDLFDPQAAEVLAERSRAALKAVTGLTRMRARDGYVRHCHGDLHLGNAVMLDDRPVLFDCLEFDPDLARIDVLYDLAYLIMDLDYRGEAEMACRALTRYLTPGIGLNAMGQFPLFLSARAAIRAKVGASARDAVKAVEDKDRQAHTARAYLGRAVAYLDPVRPRLLAVAGLSGTGKTAVARRLAPLVGCRPGAVVLRSDVIRKHLAGVPESEELPDQAYSKEMSRRVFSEIADRAGQLLAAGQSVIADAVYARPNQRAELAELAGRMGVSFDGVWLDASEETRIERVGGRVGDASDANAAVVRQQSRYDLGRLDWHRVSAEGTLDDVVDRVSGAIGPLDRPPGTP